MEIAYENNRNSNKKSAYSSKQTQALRDAIGNLLSPDDPPLALAAAWALAWIGSSKLTKTPPKPEVILALFKLWCEADSGEVRRFAAWAFSVQPLLQRDTFALEVWGDCDHLFNQEGAEGDSREVEYALLVLAWYCRSPWDDAEHAKRLSQTSEYQRDGLNIVEMLATLGAPGQKVIDDWAEQREKKKKK